MKIVGVEGNQVGVVMSKEEAQALYDITGHIGGNPTLTRRRFIDSIRSGFEEGPEGVVSVGLMRLRGVNDICPEKRTINFT